jgi:hypothetical protein
MSHAPRIVALAAALALLLAGGCLRDHDEALVQTSTNNCLTCHLHDYQDTTTPVHEGTFPRTCGDCHETAGWQPALEGLHPAAARFRITSGPHRDVPCLECHDPDRGASAAGANAICATCHTHRRSVSDDQHDEGGYQWDDANPGFCLDCHPSGRED